MKYAVLLSVIWSVCQILNCEKWLKDETIHEKLFLKMSNCAIFLLEGDGEDVDEGVGEKQGDSEKWGRGVGSSLTCDSLEPI
jgi:hypothetical protein